MEQKMTNITWSDNGQNKDINT